jgi:hypothetical protein
VTSKTFGGASAPRELVRRYHAAFHASLLTSLQMEGRRAAPIAEDAGGVLPSETGCPRLPAMTFEYAHVAAARPSDLAGYEAFDETAHAMAGSPRVNVDGQRADFFDVNADGLPDVLVTDTSTFGARLGLYLAGLRGDADTFTADTAAVEGVLHGTSASLALGNPTVVPVDIDGDGVVDLLQMPRTQTYAFYTPVARAGG